MFVVRTVGKCAKSAWLRVEKYTFLVGSSYALGTFYEEIMSPKMNSEQRL